ncbi:RHS repeat-associated core domain-containing protein [Paraburkholderia azotifigens]|uniref:RHS repeat-associated core domain-containing protein n=1 Tax=Paraburkholderia azotifigens TaxID=2057004 RepID=A0ABU9R7Y5_9BURK|nr:RHS repeat-associated core domain-containing protein [Paraburkholderia azotifigens]
MYDPLRAYAPLARVDRSNGSSQDKVCYYHTDPAGTARQVTDSKGHVVWGGACTAWGKVRANLADAANFVQPLRLPGQYQDDESGLHYNTFRYYDPHAGRFVSQDPIGLNGGLNLYQYAPNPINWIDPWGLMCETAPTRKSGGSLTEPQLPPKTIVKENGVEIVHYTRSGDHGPAHLHVKGGGAETKIGQAGKPIEGSPELSSVQRVVVENNRATIRRAIDKIQRWFGFNQI